MPDPAASAELLARVQGLTAGMLLSAGQLWATIPPANIMGTWAALATQLTAQLAATQIKAARAGAAYLPIVLDELGIDPAASGTVVAESLAVGTESGLPILDVLAAVPARALGVAAQAGPQAGLAAGRRLLEGIVETQVADSARLAASVGMTATRTVHGWVRMVEPGACSRCVVLAGKRYRWSQGFLRHPRCRCHHIPTAEDVPGDRLTDPRAYFDSLSAAEQDKAFTAAGARAIRDGADINQVVNARRGALGLTVAGQSVRATMEGTTRRGVAGKAMGNFDAGRRPGERYTRSSRARLLPESIYQLATSRDDALRLLRLYGYLF